MAPTPTDSPLLPYWKIGVLLLNHAAHLSMAWANTSLKAAYFVSGGNLHALYADCAVRHMDQLIIPVVAHQLHNLKYGQVEGLSAGCDVNSLVKVVGIVAINCCYYVPYIRYRVLPSTLKSGTEEVRKAQSTMEAPSSIFSSPCPAASAPAQAFYRYRMTLPDRNQMGIALVVLYSSKEICKPFHRRVFSSSSSSLWNSAGLCRSGFHPFSFFMESDIQINQIVNSPSLTPSSLPRSLWAYLYRTGFPSHPNN